MSLSAFNIVEILDIIYFNLFDPTLRPWGVVVHCNAIIMWIESFTRSFVTVTAFKQTVVEAVIFTIKFILLIAMLVFIRGGIPRYRYDFLTKIGWIKFLSLVLVVFLSSLLLVTLI